MSDDREPMTPEEFANRMTALDGGRTGDIEAQHSLADGLMCELLRMLGYGKGVDAYEAMAKWYA